MIEGPEISRNTPLDTRRSPPGHREMGQEGRLCAGAKRDLDDRIAEPDQRYRGGEKEDKRQLRDRIF